MHSFLGLEGRAIEYWLLNIEKENYFWNERGSQDICNVRGCVTRGAVDINEKQKKLNPHAHSTLSVRLACIRKKYPLFANFRKKGNFLFISYVKNSLANLCQVLRCFDDLFKSVEENCWNHAAWRVSRNPYLRFQVFIY